MPKVRCERCGHELRDKHIELDPDDMRALLLDTLGEYESAPMPVYGCCPTPDDFPIEITMREPPRPLFEQVDSGDSGSAWIRVDGIPYLLKPREELRSPKAIARVLDKLNEAAAAWKDR